MGPVYDLERLVTKISYGTANPRDLTAFRTSLEMLPPIRLILQDMKCSLLSEICGDLDPLEDLCSLITNAIREESAHCHEGRKYHPGRIITRSR